jgi:hypothetical protein
MPRRLSTIRLPLLALLVALFLLSHDAMMAGGPHDAGSAVGAGHHGEHGDHEPADDTACGELVAVRSNDAGADLDVAAAPGEAVILPLLPTDGRFTSTGAVTGSPPAPSRAMLQVWLN